MTGGMFSLLSTDEGRAVVLVVAILCAVDAVAFFMEWRWGWALAMLLTGVGLVFNLDAYANGDFNLGRLILLVAAAFYLNQRAVRDVFERPRHITAGGLVRMSARRRQPSPPATDLALLKAFEPIVRYNDGELFFPAAVEGYLAACDLLVGTSERDRRVLVPVGDADRRDVSATYAAPPGETLYLRLVQQPLDGIELTRWQLRPDRLHFQAPGRLARVGLFARLVDAGFTSRCCCAAPCRAARRPLPRSSTPRRARRPALRRTTAGSCAGTAGSCSSTCSSTS